MLRQLNFSVTEVNGGNQSLNPRVLNKRAEMAWEAKEFVEGGGELPKDTQLAKEMRSMSYDYTDKGRIRLPRKEDMIDDFNQSKLEQYYDFPGVESIRATEVTDDGKFVVEVEAVADLDVESMKSYLTGQYSDGGGEGFEQTEFSIRSKIGRAHV